MDQLLQMLQSTDPSDNQPDLPELLHLEGKPHFLSTLQAKNTQRSYYIAPRWLLRVILETSITPSSCACLTFYVLFKSWVGIEITNLAIQIILFSTLKSYEKKTFEISIF